MVEAFLRHEAGDQYDVHSAGTHPAQVRTEAVIVMRELGVDISAQKSKPVESFTSQQFDFVITLPVDTVRVQNSFVSVRS